jgi:SpoVK/Ycf46/Vps4 family AAA+-type ATPase
MERDFYQFVRAQSAIFDSIQSAASASGFGASRRPAAPNPPQHRNLAASASPHFVAHVPASSFARSAPPPPLRQPDKKKAGGALQREGILPTDPNARGAGGRKANMSKSSQSNAASTAESGKCARSPSSVSAGPPKLAPAAAQCSAFTDGDPRFISMIERDIIHKRADVSWDQIAALHDAKRLLRECCVMPLLMPELFTGLREPWSGVLLFGPPGTGKTLLAKAVASETATTFFNVTPASVISKYHGESEKIVTTLFAMARHFSPSVLFFDEIDSLLCERGASGEHEASRRLKTTFLSEMDGMNSQQGGRVVVIGTTNCPWDLDAALKRRLEKRIHVRLPNLEARRAAVSMFLSSLNLDHDLLEQLASCVAEASHNFSFADLRSLCKEASMAPMRRAMATHSPEQLKELQSKGELLLEVTEADVLQALSKVKTTIDAESLAKFDEWAAEFGSE